MTAGRLKSLFIAIIFLLSKAWALLDCFDPDTVEIFSTSTENSLSSSVKAILFLVILAAYNSIVGTFM